MFAGDWPGGCYCPELGFGGGLSLGSLCPRPFPGRSLWGSRPAASALSSASPAWLRPKRSSRPVCPRCHPGHGLRTRVCRQSTGRPLGRGESKGIQSNPSRPLQLLFGEISRMFERIGGGGVPGFLPPPGLDFPTSLCVRLNQTPRANVSPCTHGVGGPQTPRRGLPGCRCCKLTAQRPPTSREPQRRLLHVTQTTA